MSSIKYFLYQQELQQQEDLLQALDSNVHSFMNDIANYEREVMIQEMDEEDTQPLY